MLCALSGLCVSLVAEELHDLSAMRDEEAASHRLIQAGEVLLKHYVMLQSERLGALIKKSLSTSDWLTRKEPRDARPVVDIVIEEVGQSVCGVGRPVRLRRI